MNPIGRAFVGDTRLGIGGRLALRPDRLCDAVDCVIGVAAGARQIAAGIEHPACGHVAGGIEQDEIIADDVIRFFPRFLA